MLNEKGGTTWKIPDVDISKDKNGTTSNRICGTCRRPIKEHKQKIFDMWVCNLAYLTDGRWVHVDRLRDLIDDDVKVVYRLLDV